MKTLFPLLLSLFVGACASATHTCPSASPTSASAPDGQANPEVRAWADTDQRVAPHGKAEVALLARGDNAFVGKLVLAAGAKVPEHRDPTEEIIHVLTGSGILTMDGETYEVTPGSTITMPAGSLVAYENGPEPLSAIQIFAGPSPADKYDDWPQRE